IVAHVRGHRVVLTDVTGEPRELSRIKVPRELGEAELLLVGDKLLVLGQTYSFWGPAASRVGVDVMPVPGGDQAQTRVLVVDDADPSSPRVEQDTTYSGSLLSAREYDGTVRLVVSTGSPALDFVHPGRRRTEREATRENRQIVRESSIEDWLPTVRPDTGSEPLVECTDVRHPEESSGFSTISVVTFDAESPAARDTTAVTASGDLVYSSADRLYVATSTDGWWSEPVPLVERGAVPRRPEPPTTQVHAFALDGPRTEYIASGDVPGRVSDRWSFSEYDGHLRVATALGRDSWNPRENAVVVLEERGAELAEVGRVGGMGVREQVQSVRWFGDVVVVVTFRQVDPLYTVDLSDPTTPKVLGELKIPGFSAYLHPVGGDMLLGLGQNATRRGTSLGAQAATFDIRDLAAPVRLDTEGFSKHTDFLAGWDSRAFTYLPEQRTALAPVQNTWNGRTRVAILRLGEDGTIRRTTTGAVGGWYPSSVRTLPLGGPEVALVANGTVTKLTL
ncbi:MAG: beta-propeller domain-containing protein, partial [Nocardioidaceae bacterium]